MLDILPPYLSSFVESKAAAFSSAASAVAALPFFVAADTLPEKLTWGGALIVFAGLAGRLFSKFFDSRPKIIEAHTAQAMQVARSIEERTAAHEARMIEAHARECAAYEKQISRLTTDVDYNRARAEKAEVRADKTELIAQSASKSRHDVITDLQSAEVWIRDAMEVMKKSDVTGTYAYHFTDWKKFFERHDEETSRLLTEKAHPETTL